MAKIDELIIEVAKNAEEVELFLTSETYPSLIEKIKESANTYYQKFLKANKYFDYLDENQILSYYLIDSFYYTCIHNGLNLFKTDSFDRKKAFSEIRFDQNNDKKYYIPSVVEIKNIYLSMDWSKVEKVGPIDLNKIEQYDQVLQVFIKEFGLPLIESKKELETVLKELDSLILKRNIESLSDEQTYDLVDYLIQMIDADLTTIDLEIENLQKKYDEIPISIESDICYQEWTSNKEFDIKRKEEIKKLKTTSDIKQYVIALLASKALKQEYELQIYLAKKTVSEKYDDEKISMINSANEAVETLQTAEENIKKITESTQDLSQLYEMEEYKKLLKKVDDARKILEDSKKMLKGLQQTFRNNILMLSDQFNLPTSIKEQNRDIVEKTKEILAMKIEEDIDVFNAEKLRVEEAKKDIEQAVKDQLDVLDVVYPIYEVMKSEKFGLDSNEKVVEFFVNNLIDDSNFNIRSFIENMSKEIIVETEITKKESTDIILNSSEKLFSDTKKDAFDIESASEKIVEAQKQVELSKEQNTIDKKDLELLLKYANDLKELNNLFDQEMLEEKITDNYFSLPRKK